MEGGSETAPLAEDFFGGAEGEGHDGEGGVEAAVGHVERAVGDPQIIVAVDAAEGIGDAVARIGGEAGGAGLVLRSGKPEIHR